jgi:hypothetical protein
MLFYPVFAWGPTSHCGIISSVIASPELIEGQAKSLIINQDRYFWEGVMFPDITVMHYYTTMQKYSSTHEWQFFKDLWVAADQTLKSDEARAFALGVGTHLIQDAVVHNSYIPSKIRQYFTQNMIIHPLVEGQIEGKFLDPSDPWYTYAAKARASSAFISVELPFGDQSTFNYIANEKKRPIDFGIQYGLHFNPTDEEYAGYEYDTMQLKTYLGTPDFYSKGFIISSQLWGLYQAVGGVVKYFVNVNDLMPYYNKTVEATVGWYNDPVNRLNPENFVSGVGGATPSGLDALNDANSYVTTWFIVLGFLVIAGFGGIYFFYKRTKKNLPLPFLGSM